MASNPMEKINLRISQALELLVEVQHFLKHQWEILLSEKDKCNAAKQKIKQSKAQLVVDRRKFEYERRVIQQLTDVSDEVHLNVGGNPYTTKISTLRSIDGTMLSAMFSGRHALVADTQGRFFIDRDPKLFRYVLHYLREHKLNLSSVTPHIREQILEEFDYFCIPLTVNRDETVVLSDCKNFVNSVTLQHPVTCCCARLLGSMLVTAGGSTIKMWSLGGHELRTLNVNGTILSMDVVGTSIACGGYNFSGNGILWVLDINTENLHTLAGHDNVVEVVKMYDNQIVSCSSDKTIIRNMDSLHTIATLHPGHTDIECMDIDMSRQVAIVGKIGDEIEIRNLATQHLYHTLTGHVGGICCVKSLSLSDSKDMVVVSGSYDKTIKIWSYESGQCLMTLKGHRQGVTCVFADNNVVVSGSWDKTVKIWSKEGKCLVTLFAHVESIKSIDLVGNLLVTAALDGEVKVWKCLG